MCAITLVSLTLVFFLNRRPHNPEADGKYNWAFARSIVYDQDLNFTNDYVVCGDPWGHVARQYVKGRPDNPYYLGPSLLWVPLLTVARVVIPIPPRASPGYAAGCGRPHTSFVFFFAGPALATWLLYLCYLTSRRFTGDGPAAAACLLVGLGGSMSAYAAELPWIGHVPSATAAALLVLATLRAWEEPARLGRWALISLVFLLLVFERSTDAVLGVVPATAALLKLGGQRLRLVGFGFLMALAVVLGVLPATLVSRYLSGGWSASLTATNYMFLDQPHPFLLLFAPHGGLLYYTPAAWASVVGAPFALLREYRRYRPLIVALLIAFLLAIYVNSAAYDWHGNGTFGARRLLFMLVAMVIFAACLLQRVAHYLSSRPRTLLAVATAALMTPLVMSNLVAVIGQDHVRVRIDSASQQSDLYGTAPGLVWSWIDDQVGPLSVLPASLIFKLRYRLPTSAFYLATDTFWYKRNHMSLDWVAKHIPRFEPKLATGATVEPHRMVMSGLRATYVYAMMWPFATHMTVRTGAGPPAKVRVGRGGWFGTTWYGTVTVGPKPEIHELPVPPGGFGSGLHEVVFEANRPLVDIGGIGFDDRAPRAKPWAQGAAPLRPGLARHGQSASSAAVNSASRSRQSSTPTEMRTSASLTP